MYLVKSQGARDALKDTRWVDGLRGIASVFVVTSHIVMCVERGVNNPCCGSDDRLPTVYQLPFIRLISSGHSWVAVFFLLSGFVNSLKPLKSIRTGRPDVALSNIATSSFRRPFRLMLPAAVATVISWFLCNLGMYEMGTHSDAYWFYTKNPKPSGSWGAAIWDLFRGLRDTWMLTAENPYDQPQWLLKWLLLGSMALFLTLLITIHMSPLWRTATIIMFVAWSFDLGYRLLDPALGLSILPGILLAEFSLSTQLLRVSTFSYALTPVLLFLGGFMMSYPSSLPEITPWSNLMLTISETILPKVCEPHRTWGSFGAIISILAIMISPTLRRLLSTRIPLFLGRISYPIYLLHGIFLRTVFAWVLFLGTDKVEFEEGDQEEVYVVERYPLPGKFRITLGVAVSMGFLMFACELWQRFLEPWFGRITKTVEEYTATGVASPAGFEKEYP